MCLVMLAGVPKTSPDEPTFLGDSLTGNSTTVIYQPAIDVELGIDNTSLVLVTSAEVFNGVMEILLRCRYSQQATEGSETHRCNVKMKPN